MFCWWKLEARCLTVDLLEREIHLKKIGPFVQRSKPSFLFLNDPFKKEKKENIKFLFIYFFFKPLQTLYERCDRLRPSLFRLASDTMEDDAALAQILAANDDLTLVVNAYKVRVVGAECNGERARSKSEEVTSNTGRLHFVHLLVLVEKSCLRTSFLSLVQLLRVTERLRATTSSICQRWTLRRLIGKPIPCLYSKLRHQSSPLIWKKLSAQKTTRT